MSEEIEVRVLYLDKLHQETRKPVIDGFTRLSIIIDTVEDTHHFQLPSSASRLEFATAFTKLSRRLLPPKPEDAMSDLYCDACGRKNPPWEKNISESEARWLGIIGDES